MVHFANKVITLHCTVNGGKKLPLGITTGDWTFLKTFKNTASKLRWKKGRKVDAGWKPFNIWILGRPFKLEQDFDWCTVSETP